MSQAEFKVARRYKFSAAHHLPLVADDHKCKRPHGHNYVVDIEIFSGNIYGVVGLDGAGAGFLIDFWDLDAIVLPIIKGDLDHRDLNEIAGLSNPTAEHIAHYLFHRVAQPICDSARIIDGVNKISVTVYEEDDCWATFSNTFPT
jgi:6-pyruvoyltetrahydropterin/6-carboxytetrahydropterin synthase